MEWSVATPRPDEREGKVSGLNTYESLITVASNYAEEEACKEESWRIDYNPGTNLQFSQRIRPR